ncbi:hypothetical protein CsSME_00007410 [Camellia sinensis var. sinensis]
MKQSQRHYVLCQITLFSSCTRIANESEYGVVWWGTRWSALEGPSLILAAERTHRKDPFDNFKYYTGGWNISDHHYFYFFDSPIWVGIVICLEILY